MIYLSSLAKKLGLTKQAINYRMNKIPNFKGKYTILKNHRRFITSRGAELLSYQRSDSTSKNFHIKHGKNKNQITKSDLENELKKKDKWIAILLKNNSELAKSNSILSNKLKMKPRLNWFQKFKNRFLPK